MEREKQAFDILNQIEQQIKIVKSAEQDADRQALELTCEKMLPELKKWCIKNGDLNPYDFQPGYEYGGWVYFYYPVKGDTGVIVGFEQTDAPIKNTTCYPEVDGEATDMPHFITQYPDRWNEFEMALATCAHYQRKKDEMIETTNSSADPVEAYKLAKTIIGDVIIAFQMSLEDAEKGTSNWAGADPKYIAGISISVASALCERNPNKKEGGK